MLSKLFGKNFYHWLVFTGYLGLVVGLPLNKVVLSISTMWILAMVLLEGDFKTYFKNLRQNRVILLLLGLLLLQLLSFFWSYDLNAAVKDLVVKLPLYVIPFVFVAQPLQSKKQQYFLLEAFVLIMLITSVFNFGSYRHWWGNRVYDDIRGMSLLISHVRYSLMITMAGAICGGWMIDRSLKFRLVGLLLFLWFGFYTYYAQILSGVMTFAGILIVFVVLEVIRRKNKWFTMVALSLGILLTSGITYGLVVFFKPQKLKISLENLPERTKEGRLYLYYLDNLTLENGYPVYYFLCQEEMKREWNKRSEIPYDSLDRKGQVIEGTIIRYLTSMGLYKDAEGVLALTDKDVQNIENGIPTILVLKGGFFARLSGLKNELLSDDNPNGQSVSQRIEYWKTGWKIIRKNWLIGVGAGDIDLAYDRQYDQDHSKLTEANRLRSHNQFMSYTISLGIAGLILFCLLIVCFCRLAYKNRSILGLMFITIAVLSCLVEDTLETQMGVTFFAFFLGFFLSVQKLDEQQWIFVQNKKTK